MQRHVFFRSIAAALMAAACSAQAITNDENNSSIPFSFSNPGARSLAMGGAFVGAADDATAAYTNPAGLTGLGLEQQIGMEFRRTGFDAPYASGGTVDVDPFDPDGIRYDNASSNTNSLSFLSWVLPREGWALALYRHETLDFEADATSEPTAFGEFVTNPYLAHTDLEMTTWGASFAYDFNEHLALGVGLSYYEFEIDTSTTRIDAFSLDRVVSRQMQSGDDHDLGYNVGLLFRGSDNFNIGLAYRSAPDFDYRATNVAGEGFLADLFAPGVFTGELLADKPVAFNAPDTLSLGFSWRPRENLTINLDINHIGYSNLGQNNVTPFFNEPDNPLSIVTQRPFTLGGVLVPAGTRLDGIFQGPDGIASPGEIVAAQRIGIEDIIEPRLGLEYIFAEARYPVALRAGAWYEENHTLRYQGDVSGTTLDELLNAQLNAIVFSTGDDQMHWSAGIGVVFSNFQVDAAVDVSDRQDVLSVSGVWRF